MFNVSGALADLSGRARSVATENRFPRMSQAELEAIAEDSDDTVDLEFARKKTLKINYALAHIKKIVNNNDMQNPEKDEQVSKHMKRKWTVSICYTCDEQVGASASNKKSKEESAPAEVQTKMVVSNFHDVQDIELRKKLLHELALDTPESD